MRRVYYMVLMLVLVVAGASAQNKNTARKLFNEGRFEEAKPMFAKLLKGSPKNSEYNYWYAACCIETGEDSVDVCPMLEFAISRKIANAYLYMGKYYLGERDYPRAADYFDEFIDVAKGDSLRDLGYDRLEFANRMSRMVRNTEVVCFIDSFVVDKDAFLEAYKMGPDVGRLALCADFFGDSSLSGVLYESERGMDVYFSMAGDADAPATKIYHKSRVGDEWTVAKMLEGFDTGGNDGYPFMLSDGSTLYFASDGNNSIGGYDLFVTSFDSESDEFYRPSHLGMPFNSTANDYMLAINEVAGIGWFASDRNQPEDKVCVYVFIAGEEKSKYDIESLGYEKVLAYADIASIVDTQVDDDVMRRARQQYTMLLYAGASKAEKGDFLFVVDDIRDYHSLSDFKSESARGLYKEWQARNAALADNMALLEELRGEYAVAAKSRKDTMRAKILGLENSIEVEEEALGRMLLEVRRLEQAELYK